MTGSLVDVDREVLLTELRKKRLQMIAENDKAIESYPARQEAWNAIMAKALHTLADSLNGKAPRGMDVGYRGESVTLRLKANHLPEVPVKPSKSADVVCRIDRMIRTVELVKAPMFRLRTDDEIVITALGDRC